MRSGPLIGLAAACREAAACSTLPLASRMAAAPHASCALQSQNKAQAHCRCVHATALGVAATLRRMRLYVEAEAEGGVMYLSPRELTRWARATLRCVAKWEHLTCSNVSSIAVASQAALFPSRYPGVGVACDSRRKQMPHTWRTRVSADVC